MSKKFLVRKSAAILGLIGALSMSFFNSCTQDNPTALNQDKPKYDFSGFVLDGYTGKALGGAVVTYYNNNNDSVTFTTRADGGFKIKDIPYGDKSFFFSYRPAGATAVQYTTAAVTIEGNDWINFAAPQGGLGAGAVDTAFGAIKNVAGPVKLYPLSGSLTGSVLSQIHARGELNPVGNTVVKVTFDPNSDNDTALSAVIGSDVEIGPRTFEAITDATGRFTITGLPVSGDENEKVKIKVVSITSGGIDWTMKDHEGIVVELVAGQSVPVGQIIMNPMEKIELAAIDNNFKTGVVSPEHTFEITYSDSLDSVASYAVLSSEGSDLDDEPDADKRNIYITTKVSGKKISINPAYSLVNEEVYTLTVFAYGLKGQEKINGFTVTVAGGGLADVVSSNILTDTKSPVYNVGVKAPITFTFADSIVGIPSVQVENTDIIVSTSGKILTITPKSIWKDGTVSVNVVLFNGTTVSFTTPLYTENSLAFVTSNVCDFNAPLVGSKLVAKNGLGLTDLIVFTTNKEIIPTSVKVILKDPDDISLPVVSPVVVAEGNQQISIQPINALKPAAKYTVLITVENTSGESKSAEVEFTTTAAKFFPIFDNVRIGNDANMPRLDFAPNANIVIKMNKKVAKATAYLTLSTYSGDDTTLSPVASQVSVLDSIISIDPEIILDEGTQYNLDLTAEDSAGNIISGRYVTGLTPRALVIILASNIITGDNESITNADRAITPWFKLSSAPVAASIKVDISVGGNLYCDGVVTVNADTLFVNPVADFQYGVTPTITITGFAADGNYIGGPSFVKSFSVQKKPVAAIVASNVLNSNFEGLTNVDENIEMWYKLSRTPVAASLSVKVDGNESVVRVSGDTVFVKATYTFAAGLPVGVTITGLDIDGLSITIKCDGTAGNYQKFTVRSALFPVASNTWGVKGEDDPAKNFAFYDTMWVKYSKPLSTNLLDIDWFASGADVEITADPADVPNATAWVKGDTLFVLPDNRAAITFDKTVGFAVTVKTAAGQASGQDTFMVAKVPLNFYVKSTNTKDINGDVRKDFGLRDTIWVVPSVAIDSIISVNSVTIGADIKPVPDVLNGMIKSRTRLSANGDTIFYVPSAKLAANTTYDINFTVRLKNQPLSGSKTFSEPILWTTKAGVLISATNLMASVTTHRQLKVIGDEFVVTFTKAIDTAFNAPVPFKVNGFVDNVTKTWSADLKTVTIRNIDTLNARDYSVAQNDLTTNNTDYDYELSFNLTCSDGEECSVANGNEVTGSNLHIGRVAIKTEYKCALIGTNLINNHTVYGTIDPTSPGGIDVHKDTFAIAGNPTLVFNRAIDTVRIKADVVNLYQNFIQLRKNGSSLPIEYVISFSSDAKTVTIDPVAVLDYGTQYDIVITGIPVVGIKNADAFSGNGTSNSILNSYDFKTVNAPPVFLAGKATTIYIDSQSTTLRYGYTPANAAYGAGALAAGSFRVKIQKTAWNVNYSDSVDGYQFSVQTSANPGYTILSTATPNAGGDYDPFDPQVNGTSRFYQYTVNVATDPSGIYSSLLIPDGGASYTNGDNMLNHATSVQIRARAFKLNGAVPSYAEWSAPITFGDNVAPGDPDFGSTNISATPHFAEASFDRAANATNDSSNYIDVDFPEDMDVATVPSIGFYDGRSTGSTAPTAAANSGWQNARKYRFYIKLTSGVNYTYLAATREWYLKISVVGMKDYSGVTLVSSGTAPVPAAANGAYWSGAAAPTVGATTASFQGNLNVGTGNGKPGLYVFP